MSKTTLNTASRTKIQSAMLIGSPIGLEINGYRMLRQFANRLNLMLDNHIVRRALIDQLQRSGELVVWLMHSDGSLSPFTLSYKGSRSITPATSTSAKSKSKRSRKPAKTTKRATRS
jgi:hypothetical protein